MDKERILIDYLEKEILRRPASGISEDTDLLSTGILNSLSLLQLVSFIERRFNCEIPAEEVVYENLHSVSAMVDYLNKDGGTG